MLSRVKKARAKSMSAQPRSKMGKKMKNAVKKLTAVRKMAKPEKVQRLPHTHATAGSANPFAEDDMDDVPAEFIITPRKVRESRRLSSNAGGNDAGLEAQPVSIPKSESKRQLQQQQQQQQQPRSPVSIASTPSSPPPPMSSANSPTPRSPPAVEYTPKMRRMYRASSAISVQDDGTPLPAPPQSTGVPLTASGGREQLTVARSLSFLDASNQSLLPDDDPDLVASVQRVESMDSNSWLVDTVTEVAHLSVEELKAHDIRIELRCSVCNRDFETQEATQEHYAKCSEELIACPRGCEDDTTGEVVKMKRKDAREHLMKVCPLSVIECPYFKNGCVSQFRRETLDAHMMSNVKKHLDLHLTTLPGSDNVLEEDDPTLRSLMRKYQPLYRVELPSADVQQRIDEEYQVLYDRGLRAHENGDFVVACTCFEQLALQGHADSQYRLGCYADSGLGAFRDSQMANNYFLFAAKQGHVAAQVALGMGFYNGDGVLRDLERACFWLRKACENESARAMSLLGGMYASGQRPLEKNPELALKWYLRAARRGNAQAFSSAAKLLRHQALRDPDRKEVLEKKAFHFFMYAAMVLKDPEGHVNVGLCFESGVGVPVDPIKALDHYRVAALQHQHPRGIARLANCYLSGIGTEKNIMKALRLFRTAKMLGDTYAKNVVDKYAKIMQNVPSNITQPLPVTPVDTFAAVGAADAADSKSLDGSAIPNDVSSRSLPVANSPTSAVRRNVSFIAAKPKIIGQVTVTILQGRNLVAKDSDGTSDPYCKVSIVDEAGERLGKENQTGVIKSNCINPVWNVVFNEWSFKPDQLQRLSNGRLLISVYDYDRFSKDDFMGQVSVRLQDAPPSQAVWLMLTGRPGKQDAVSGELCISITV